MDKIYTFGFWFIVLEGALKVGIFNTICEI